jgi:hypothetical protein
MKYLRIEKKLINNWSWDTNNGKKTFFPWAFYILNIFELLHLFEKNTA